MEKELYEYDMGDDGKVMIWVCAKGLVIALAIGGVVTSFVTILVELSK